MTHRTGPGPSDKRPLQLHGDRHLDRAARPAQARPPPGGIIGYLITLLQGLGMSLEALGDGRVFNGLWRLIGVLLLAAIFYLMALVTMVFIHWLFGLLGRATHVAMERIGPLLDLFEFGGVFAGWSFLILWIALSIAAAAVRFIFFR